jgi:glycosyltransferase involved in cell wall biosynthesis
MLVSVLTPSYNQGRYVRDAIESVIGQDYPNVEHVVIDGGSTDETLSRLEPYADRITLVSEPDDGQADALNKAFERSTGEIIGWLNSDDFYLTSDAVRSAVDVFRAHPGVGVVYGHAVWIDAHNRVVKTSLRPRFDRDRLHRFDYISQPAAFVRRAVAPRPLVDASLQYALDYGLWLALAGSGVEFRRIPVPLAAMRQHDMAKSFAKREVMWTESEELRQRYGPRPTTLQAAWDTALMATNKIRGLGAFHRGALGADRWVVDLTLPPPWSRILHQFDLVAGACGPLLFPRYMRMKLASRDGRDG